MHVTFVKVETDSRPKSGSFSNCAAKCSSGDQKSSQSSPQLSSASHPSHIFTASTKAIVWGMQTRAVQGMLDFDYVCSRETPSVVAILYPLV